MPGVEQRGIVSVMPTIALQAHFDGHQIVLDEPYDLPANANLMVTLLSEGMATATEPDSESAWLRAAAKSEAFAFLADEGEDIYSLADGKPFTDSG